eukprot:g10151.t1
MFNPCTMVTSCGIPNGGKKSEASGKRSKRGVPAMRTQQQQQPRIKRDRARKSRLTTGLSAPMLKALLKRGTPAAAGLTAGAGGQAAACVTAHGGDAHQEVFDPTSSNPQDLPAKSKHKFLVVNGQEELSDSSINSDTGRLNESMWRSVDQACEGTRGDLKATWLTTSSRGGGRRRRGGLGDSVEEIELRRIFSDERPPWDGTPAPLPAPRNVRRAISSLLMPDPDERLRDKLIKSRKAAAGIPVTTSSAKDEVHSGPVISRRQCVC